MSENSISYKQYWDEIRDLAKEAKEADEPNDAVHELIDQHQWVIYRAFAFDVLKHCSNENAYFEDFGNVLDATEVGEVLVKLVYAAMCHDVFEAMQE